MPAPVENFTATEDHLKEIYTKAGINLIFQIGGVGLRFLFVWLIIHWFGSTEYGEWSLAGAILVITGVLANLGLSQSVVRFVAESRARDEPGRLRDAFQKSLVLATVGGLLLGVGLYLSSEYISLAFNKPGLKILLRIVAFGLLPMSILMLCSGALRGLRQITAHSFVKHTGTPMFATGILVIGYFAFDYGQMYALAYVISLWLMAGVSFALWSRLSRFMKLRESNGSLKYRELLTVSLPMFTNESVRLLKNYADIIMIGFFCSTLELAAYSLALRLTALIVMPQSAINSIAAAKYTEFKTVEDVAGMAHIARQSTRMISLISLPLVLVIVVLSEWLLEIFDSTLVIGAGAMIIIALGQLFSAMSGSVGLILNMTGHERSLRNIILLTSGLNVLLNFMLIPVYGIVGAAVATSFTIVLNNVLGLYKVKKEFNFVPFYFPLAK